jgi:diguanylate cyclase (GGDEF)-like protein
LVLVEPLQEEIRWTRALEEREAALLRAQRVARLGSWQVDLTGGRWHWSPELYRILAIPEEQPPSLSLLLARIHPDDRDLLAHSLERLQGGEGHDLIVRLLLPDGSIRWVRELSEVVWDAAHRPVRAEGTVQDITDQKLAEAKMEALAFFDPLTQLPNRALLTDRLHQALAVAERRRQPLALLFLDLNHFKEINDTLGHEVGDQVLITVAQRLRQTLREAEHAARLGGDEFVVVVSAGPEQASRIAERIAVALAEPLHLAGKSLVISTSIGIALYPSDGVTPQDLLRCADIAMYRAKSEGKFLCFYHAGMGLEMARRLEMAQRLSQAIAQKRLRLAYQAQVALADQRLVGAEALCRWSDPEWGIVPPAEFIPLAEERGLITSLGEWVLESACRQLREWEQTIGPMAIRIAVNVGARHFETDTYFEETVRQVRDARISPHSIELELTESSMVRDPERAVAVMTALAAEGFSLAIDDFGTGYSSLVYLKRFPVHRLKIDFSFVRDMLEDRNDRAIVSTVIAMGRSLELETIAEGVERPEQAAALQEIGCHYAQGYLFGRPQDADAFAAQWLQQR